MHFVDHTHTYSNHELFQNDVETSRPETSKRLKEREFGVISSATVSVSTWNISWASWQQNTNYRHIKNTETL